MDANNKPRRIDLTDTPSIAIVCEHQRRIGDATAGRTLNRIVQAFHYAGLSLVPDPQEANPSTGKATAR